MTRLLAALAALMVVPVALAAPPPPDDARPLPTIGGVSGESRVEPRISAIATNLAGRVVAVRCWSTADWDRLDREWEQYVGRGLAATAGYVRRSARERLQLSPLTCSRLVAFIYSGWRPTNRQPAQRDRLGAALRTLTHEAQHSRGIDDEQVAECRGIQLVRPVARLLGATRDYAAFIAGAAWKRNYGAGDPTYRTSRCRNGGPLDINPRANAWP